MTGHEGNVIAELTADHREVEGLFQRYKGLGAGHADDRRKLADEFTIELVRHSVAEEQYLYPAVREHVPGGAAMADKEEADHARVEGLLKRIETADSADPAFEVLLDELITEVVAHVQDEEQRLFPALADACSPEDLLDLGEKVRAAKKTAPTRPHPDGGDGKLATAGMGMVDRVRDLFTGRGRS